MVRLGVGRNMVNAIQYWLQAARLVSFKANDAQPAALGQALLAKAPPAKWRDAHRVNAELRLEEMVGQLPDLEALRQALPEGELEENSEDKTLLLKLVRPGTEASLSNTRRVT